MDTGKFFFFFFFLRGVDFATPWVHQDGRHSSLKLLGLVKALLGTCAPPPETQGQSRNTPTVFKQAVVASDAQCVHPQTATHLTKQTAGHTVVAW